MFARPHFLLFLLLITTHIFAQDIKPKLLAPPVVGSVTPTSAKVWIGYRGTGNNVLILSDSVEKKVYYPVAHHDISNNKGDVALTMTFKGLQPEHTYNILVNIEGDKKGSNTKYSFTTPSDAPVKDFNFLLGSCLLSETGFFRFIFPGFKNEILNKMRKRNGDFMLWLGDNTYMLGKDYKNYNNMFRKQMNVRRKFSTIRKMLANQPNYAIWDDHDFGPNDSYSVFALKDSALKVFKGFWPNTYPEEASLGGNFFKFKRHDSEFFMMDDRFFRGDRHDTLSSMLGEVQMDWLKQQLLSSTAAFKFIAIGSQVLSELAFGEKYIEHIVERNLLLNFIATNNIKGVIFLSGDMHFTELCKKEWKSYPMYDYSCSALTAPSLPLRLFKMNKNPNRIEGTKVGGHNFGKIEVSGEPGNRVCTMYCYSRKGKLKWTFSVNQNELQVGGKRLN